MSEEEKKTAEAPAAEAAAKPKRKRTVKKTAEPSAEGEKKPAVKKAAKKPAAKKPVAKKAAAAKDSAAKAAEKAEPAKAEKAEAAPAVTEEKKEAPAAAAPAKETKPAAEAAPSFKTRKPTVKDFDIIIGPLVTEKTQYLQAHENKMVFKVASKANASEVKAAVQAIFGVKVDKVNIINVKPKHKNSTRYGGKISGFKKAIVKINKAYDLGEIAKAAQAENA